MDILRKFLIYILLPSLISIAVGLALTHKLYPYIALILIIAIISTFIIILNLEWKLRKKLRHFEKLRKKSFTIDDNMNFYKGSSPRQEDIGSDRDVIRELHYKLFPQILETKNSQKNSYLSIIAPPQEGKSTLLLRFARELADRKKIVLWADANDFTLENPFNELKFIRRWRKKRIFAIIDNIARLQRYEEFLQDIAYRTDIKVTLIGASRVEDWEKVKYKHWTGLEYLFEKPNSTPRLPYRLEITEADIEAAKEKLREKRVLKRERIGRMPENFSILIWALAVPEGEEDFSQRILEEADSLSPLEKKAYCYICALDRFGLPMPSPLIKRLIGKDAIGCLEGLEKKGVIRYIDKIDSYISRHEIVAETIFSDFCPQIPASPLCKLYNNIVKKATLKEDVLMVLLFQIYLEKDLRTKLKDELAKKYENTFSKSKSALIMSFGWGLIFHDLLFYELAENIYRKSLIINEKFPVTHNNYANLLKDLKRYQEAEQHYRRALELKEDFIEARYNYANLLAKMNKYPEAEKHYKRALELKEDYPQSHTNYANLLAEQERIQDAEVHYKRALELKEDLPEAHVNYAVLLYKSNKYGDAEFHYKKALTLEENDPVAHYNYAILLVKLKRYPEAEEKYKRALELKEDFPQAYINYAILLVKLERYQEADKHYQRALELKEDFPEAYNNYASLLYEMKRYTQAEQQYKRALELKENYPEAHNNYALLLVELEKYQEAEGHYKRALELKEDYPEAHFNYANLLVKLEIYGEAEVHFKRALELEKDFPIALANLGFLYRDLQKPQRAIYWLMKAWEHRDKLPDKGESVKAALEALSFEKGKKKEGKSPENGL